MSATSRREMVSREEWFPVYIIELDPGWRNEDEVAEFGRDIPVELVARYEKNLVEFDSIQAELRKIVEANAT